MRYLRMFSNAVLAGGLGAVYLSVLFLQLNPTVPLYPMNFAPLVVTLALSYGVHMTVVFYALIVARQIVAAEPLSPGWVSLRLLSWLFGASALFVATLMWFNLRAYAPMLALDTSRRMAAGAAVLTMCALMYLAVAFAHYSFGRRKGRVGATFVGLAFCASLVLPLAARGPGESLRLMSRPLDIDAVPARSGTGGHVVVIALDGASLDFLSTAALDGRLPSFGKILDRGAAMHLATVRPTQPDPVWTTVSTGKLPARSGVRSAARYRVPAAPDPLELLPDNCFAHGLVYFGFVQAIPHTSASIRVRPIWSILGTAGLAAGVVNWPLTYPAQSVRGYLVSDQFYRPGDPSLEPDDPAAIHPIDMLPLARSAGETVAPGTLDAAKPLLLEATDDQRQDVAEGRPFVTDRMYEEIARTLEARVRPALSAVRYRTIDAAGHRFLRFAIPREFGDVSTEDRRKYGQALEQAYTRIDAVLGRALSTLGPDDLLLVISGFGMEPLTVGKRLLDRVLGIEELSGSHEDAPDGFLLAYGAAVEPGRKLRASVVDVVPTILYFMGLPVARDMDGYARTDIFQRDFTESRPIAFIPTYER
ncbi:MAG TPA: alkaline phosphatase family protein [Vicinamibacterales bacterium]|jgi:hypothetical protein